MTDFYDLNPREKDDGMDNDLEERLSSVQNMIDLAFLALYSNSHYLIPTALEEAYYKLQTLVDDYCVIE